MSDYYIGEIRLNGYNFAQVDFAFCWGQLQSIAANNALFALLGTTYGGDGVTTFGLPDLRGRWPVGQGQGPGLSPYSIGQMAGQETVTLTTNQLPSHTHSLTAQAGPGVTASTDPTFNRVSSQPSLTDPPYDTAAPTQTMSASSTSTIGGSQPHENRPPFLALNYVIALFGVFPPRN